MKQANLGPPQNAMGAYLILVVFVLSSAVMIHAIAPETDSVATAPGEHEVPEEASRLPQGTARVDCGR